MSIYSEISKQIGWDSGKKVSIPSIEDAKELHNQVLVNRSIDAFKKVFEIYRFAPTPDGGDDSVAMKFIYEAFTEGKRFFE